MRVATYGLRAVSGLLVVAMVTTAIGQDVGLDNRFLPAPRSLVQRLSRAREAIQAERYNEAVEQLGSILSPNAEEDLEGEIDQDYFIAPSQQGGAMPSLKSEAQRLIASMSAQGRDMYELRYGAVARDLLRQALEEANVTKLTEVTRRYFHTRAGYEAMMLLGRRHMDEGRPLAAALCFQRLAESPQALATYEPDLSILLAICWIYADVPEHAEATINSLRERMPGARIELAGKTVTLENVRESPLAWLEGLLGPRGAPLGIDQDQWVLYRGSADRNGRSTGSMPVVNFRWRVPTANDPNDEQSIDEYKRQQAGSGTVLLPTTQPIAVDDTVLMRTPRRLMAIDFETGKRIWEFPWDDTPDLLAETSQDLPQGRNVPSQRTQELAERLWQDAAYGQISSNGQSVFVLSDLGFASGGNTHMLQPGGFQQLNPGSPKSHNKLVSLSLEREGALEWVVGGEDGADEPRLAGAFFLGVPLPAMGQLFVLAELAGELRLVVLDARTGKLEWQQQLAHVDTLTIQTDMQRRLAGATPSFADGVLVCPTSAGAVVAVDVSNRSLLWGYQYPTNLQSLNNRFAFNRPVMRTPSEEGWIDATATIADGRVLLTPVESDELHCLDLLTGEPVWKGRRRGDYLFIACVHDGKVILVGKSSVQALSLADGNPVWPSEVALPSAAPSGRGFYSEGYYFLPTTASSIVKIDLSEGRIVEQAETPAPLGNLICYKDQLISQNVDWLTTFYQSEPLRALVEQRLAANPQDRWALARKCELLLQDGKQAEALNVMWATYQADPSDETMKSLLVTTLLDALKNDFPAHVARVRELETLIDQPEQHANYLRILSTGLEQMGDYAGAFEAVMQLADARGYSPDGLLRDATPEVIDRQWSVERRRWVQGRLTSLLQATTRPEHRALRESWNAEIAARRARALEADTRTELRHFLEQFGTHPAADAVRLQYARRLMADGEWLAAELQLEGLTDHADPQVAAPANALMARLLMAARRPAEAMKFFDRLANEWPQVEIEPGVTAAQVAAEAPAKPQLLTPPSLDYQWPYGKVLVERSTEIEQALANNPRTIAVTMRDARGHWPDGTRFVIDSRTNAIQVYDAFGRALQQIQLNGQRSAFTGFSALSHAKARGHLAVISSQAELIVVDLLRHHQDAADPVLWRIDLTENSSAQSVRGGVQPKNLRHPWTHTGIRNVPGDASAARIPIANMGPVTRHGICYQRFHTLICADPLTGEVVWTRDGIEPGADIFGDEELLFVVPYDHEEALVLRTATGQLIGKRPVEKLERRWTTWGRNVLAWENRQNRLSLRVYDAWSGRDLWSGTFPAGSRGELVEDDEVAVVDPRGNLTIVSLRDGHVALEQQLNAIDDLAFLYVQRSQQQYIVMAGKSVTPVGQRISVVGPKEATPVMNGWLYAFSRATGEMQWTGPAEVEQYSVPFVQPAESPVLVLMRTVVHRAPQNRQSGSLVCIDKRDGRLLLADEELGQNIAAYQIVADPQDNTLRVSVPGQACTLTFTDQSHPPAPPARVINTSSSSDE